MGPGDKAKFKVGDRVATNCGFTFDPNEGVIVATYECDEDLYAVSGIDHPDTSTAETWHYRTEHLKLLPVAANAQPAPLTIREGGYYRTRDGRKVGPMEMVDGHWSTNRGRHWYNDDGSRIFGDDDGTVIIAEWVDEPVATVVAGGNNDTPPSATTGFTIPTEAFEPANIELTDEGRQVAGSYKQGYEDGYQRGRAERLKRGDLVTLHSPALVTGIDGNMASIQTDGGNYSLPLEALRAA